jgi:hypothetical protein
VRRLAPAALAGAAILFSAASSEPLGGFRVLDDFGDASSWTASPSDGVRLSLTSDAGQNGKALRLDFDFGGRAGWAAVRKAFPIRLPENWVIDLRLRGDTPPQTLEFKLLDSSGENVWWSVRRPYEFPREWTTLRIRKRQVSFAWGPAGGGELADLGFLEVTVTAASGGKGTVWLDELALEELPLATKPPPPTVRASSSVSGSGPERALDGDPATSWRSVPASGESQDFSIDLGQRREFGSLVLDWDPHDFPRRYAIEVSDDGKTWSVRKEISGARGGRAYLFLPDSDSRFIRLKFRESARGAGYALREVAVAPPGFSETPTAFLQNVARDAPRGAWPRSFVGQQLYWALVGVDGGRDEGLLSEDGALETGRGGFSLEPFLWTGGKLLGWADAETSHALDRGTLPIPSVTRRHAGGLELEVTAFADGPPAGSTLRVRYRVRNASKLPLSAKLFLAARPLQVNPPSQFLNVPGGFSPIRKLAREAGDLRVEGNRSVVILDRPSEFGASGFDAGEISTWLAEGKVPPADSAADPDGFASAAFAWDLDLPAGGRREVAVAVPLPGAGALKRPDSGADFDSRLANAARAWEEKTGRVTLDLPGPAAAFGRTVRSNAGWILINRDGPAIQPGSRSYSRSWIRDGALTSAALLRLGHEEVARDYLKWFAPFQFDDGKVPCCVDRRGADPVPENDSHGELLYLAGEYYRFTGDRETIEAVWPHLARAAGYIDTLRRQRRTPEYAAPGKRIFFGLLPESISHEGYSAHPVHSFWDDFWAVKGLSDAAELARALGRDGDARRFAASRDELRADVHASIRRVIASRGIDFVPGSAELADLDATSTTIALSPGEEGKRLPPRELARTFERYWESFRARRAGTDGQEAYTPYEWRTVGAFVRLGWRERAKELADFLLADRRPAAWNQWAEVVWRDPRAAKFIGDMPHGWVGSDYIRSLLDFFAYDRPEDGALVLGAGVPADWLRASGGVSIRGLRTRWGRLDLALLTDGEGLRVSISGGLRVPPGGFALRPPLAAAPRRVTVGGKAVPFSGTELVVRTVPAEVLFQR